MPFVKMIANDGIYTITLNRPEKRNALNQEMVKALLHALQKVAQDDYSRVLIIQGHGEAFCAGADIAWMQTVIARSYDENYDDAQLLADFLYQLYTFPRPTIVLAHGIVLGGGLGLLAAADIAIAAENTSFGFSEVRLGLTPSCISPYVLAAIGERAARYYFLTGEHFNTSEAYRMGLIHRVVEAHALADMGLGLAKELLVNSPQAMHAVKQLVQFVMREKINEALIQKTAEHLAAIRSSPEAQEGLRAFLEKRKARW